jgi:hypothetical protein
MTANAIRPAIMRILAACLLLAPPVLLAVLLWRDGVNIPYWDQWDGDIAGIFVKFKTHQLAFADFWAQHNESRLVLPRMFFLFLGNLTHWNIGYEIAATFLAACLIAAAIWRLEQTAFQSSPIIRWMVFFISSLLIFSPAQSEAWLWGLESILYVPVACILFSLLTMQSQARGIMKWLVCAALATVSTYAFSNGLLAWIVLFPALVCLADMGSRRKNNFAILCWLFAFAGNAALYFYDYQFQPTGGFWQKLWTDPFPIAEYFFAFLGQLLTDQNAPHSLETAVLIGLCLTILFGASCFQIFKRRKNPELINNALPWLTLGGYSILSGCLATAGRATLIGPDQALSPRYGIFGACLIVSLLHLIALTAFHEPARKDDSKSARSRIHLALPAFGICAVLLYAIALPSAVFNMYLIRLQRLEAKSCLDFIDVIPEQPSMTGSLFPNYQKLKRTADSLDQLGVLDFFLLKTNRIADFKSNLPPDNPPFGSIESFHQTGAAQFELTGWAVSTSRNNPADCVLFTCESVGIEPMIFSLMDRRMLRPDLAAKFKDQNYFVAGWRKTFTAATLPKGSLQVKAWAYDTRSRKITPLAGVVQIDNN